MISHLKRQTRTHVKSLDLDHSEGIVKGPSPSIGHLKPSADHIIPYIIYRIYISNVAYRPTMRRRVQWLKNDYLFRFYSLAPGHAIVYNRYIVLINRG